MVYIARFLGAAALFSGLVAGLPRPRPDSSDEAAVSAPNGIPLTEGATPPAMPTAASGCGSSGCGMASQSMKDSKMMESGCGSSGCGDSSQMKTSKTTSSTMMHEKATSTMMHEKSTPTMMHEATSTMASETKMTAAAMSMPTYGSGSSNWNMGSNSGYNDCVQQCMATFGMATGTYTPPTATAASTGTGTTHTIIVAPTQGVLRYVPWAVNASAGDTVKFMWGANNHTVTKGSALLPCNKSNDSTFATGQQSKGFTFDLKINDTEPVFFFCGTPTHCQKGMFAAINAPSSAGSATSVGSMMPALAANNSNVAAYAVYTANQTKGDASVAGWGANLDMSAFPDWSHEFVAENVMYTRAFLANNKDLVMADGSVDLSAAGTNPLMIPQDPSSVLAAYPSSSSPSTSAPASAPAAAQPTESTVAPAGSLSTSGAASVSSSRLAATLVVAFAAWLLL